MDEATNKVNDARTQETYFLDVIQYFNAKLHYLQMVENSLYKREIRDEEGQDYDFYMQIQPEKQLLWDMLADLNDQLVDVQHQISDLEFVEF